MQVENHVRYFLLNIIMIPKISIVNKFSKRTEI